jgi:glycosyltransferase involved in cell wall biosynthesis
VSEFQKRQIDRICYLAMKVALLAGYALTRVITALSPFARPRRFDGDLALFPYAPPDYPGYAVRIGNYLPLLERDGVSYRVFAAATAEDLYSLDQKLRRARYLFYVRVFWRRLAQVLQARHFRVAFVQRGLFPYYPDQRNPYLEQLLRRLVSRSVVDFYDADYVPSPVIVDASIRYFDRVTVVGAHIERHFSALHPDVRVFPLCVRLEEYAEKRIYAAGRPARILWMGSVGNASRLRGVQSVLRDLAEQQSVRLVVICRQEVDVPGMDVEWVPWSDRVADDVLKSCDVAIYPAEDSEADRGKMALKVLEYMAVGLPVVAVPYGLAPCVVHGKTALVVEGHAAWIAALTTLLEDDGLRERLGRNARRAVERHHTPEVVYPQFKRLVFAKDCP